MFLDLEDAVAPTAKAQARANWPRRPVTGAAVWSRSGSTTRPPSGRTVTCWNIVSGGRVNAVILPKVASRNHVVWLDLLLGQVEREAGLPVGRTGIEAQIEDARGLAAVNAIAAASPRLEALVFGPPTSWPASGSGRWTSAASRRATSAATRITTR